MSCTAILSASANVAQIATAVVAVLFYVSIRIRRIRNRKRVEQYLKEYREKSGNPHRVTKTLDGETLFPVSALDLSIVLGISEQEIVDLSFGSKTLRRHPADRWEGEEPRIAIEFVPDPKTFRQTEKR